jgi:hypothetical protein
LIIIGALAAMHVGIAVCLTVGLFSIVSLAGLCLFLPAEFWNSRWFALFSRRTVGVRPRGEPEKRHRQHHPPARYVVQGVCLLTLLYVLAVNINGLPSRYQGRRVPVDWAPLTLACGLGQKWNMFETIPSKDGWYVAEATLTDGSQIDLLRPGPTIDWSRPSFPAGLFPNHRWQKCFREMAYYDVMGYQVFRRPVAEYLCRVWNIRNAADKRIKEFVFIYCMERPDQDAGSVDTGSPNEPITCEELVRLEWHEP